MGTVEKRVNLEAAEPTKDSVEMETEESEAEKEETGDAKAQDAEEKQEDEPPSEVPQAEKSKEDKAVVAAKDEERMAIAKEIATVLVEDNRKREEAEVAKTSNADESQKAEPPVEVTEDEAVKNAETEAMETSMEAVEVEIEKNQELEVSLSIEEANVDSANDAKVDESQPTADQAPKEEDAKSPKLNVHFSTSFHTHVVPAYHIPAPDAAETPEDRERIATLKEIATALVEACMKRDEAEVARIAAESEIRIRNGVEKAEEKAENGKT